MFYWKSRGGLVESLAARRMMKVREGAVAIPSHVHQVSWEIQGDCTSDIRQDGTSLCRSASRL